MIQQFETIQKASKDNVDATLKAFDVSSKGVQAIATEATDYAKKSFQAGTAVVEKLADGFGMGPEQLMAAAVAEIPAP